MNGDILELAPREVLLPKVKPRREAPTSHRGVFLRCSLLPAAIDRTALLYRRRPEHATDEPDTGSAFAAIETLRPWPTEGARLVPSLAAPDN